MIRRTLTIGLDIPGAQVVSLYPGHVDRDTFEKAFTREWGDEDGRLDPAFTITHEWWVRPCPGKWELSEKGASMALPVTVMKW